MFDPPHTGAFLFFFFFSLTLSPSVSQAGPAHVLHPSGGIPSSLSGASDECIHVQVSGSSSATPPPPTLPKGRHLISAASMTFCNHISPLPSPACLQKLTRARFFNLHCLHRETVYRNSSNRVLTIVISTSEKRQRCQITDEAGGVRTTKGCEV